MAWAVGIDLGGTNVRAGAVAEDGGIAGFVIEPVDRQTDGEGLASLLAKLVADVRGDKLVVAVGAALPATLRAPDGEILPGTSNLPGLEGFPILKRMQELTGLRCAIGNDADLALWGEARYGAARHARNAVAITLGTGIGSGLMLDGRLWSGSRGHGAELGLTRVPEPSSASGRSWIALETLASAEALRNLTGSAAEQVYASAKRGDRKSQALIEAVCEYLAIAIANAHLLLDLEVAVLCGGMAKAGAVLLDGVKRQFEALCPPPYRDGLTIALGELGDRAAVAGAASLAFGLTPVTIGKIGSGRPKPS
jgi:glucokinase